MNIALALFEDNEDFQEYSAGDVVFNEGDTGKFMYVIIDGEVNIVAGDNVVDQLSAGDIFGEMALIDSSPRIAGAIASTDCKLVPVDEYNFTHYVQHSPFFSLHVMSVMANRLRASF